MTTPSHPTHLPVIALARTDERNMTEMIAKDPFQDLTRVIEVHDAMNLTDIAIFSQNAQLPEEEKEKSESNFFK